MGWNKERQSCHLQLCASGRSNVQEGWVGGGVTPEKSHRKKIIILSKKSHGK